MADRNLQSTARNSAQASVTAEGYIGEIHSTMDDTSPLNHFRLTMTENCINATSYYFSSPSSPLTPSTYNWAALALFIIVVMTIGGNVLVCLAVCYKRKLQNMFNYFLVSLALSDMLSATIVMPLSIIKETIDQFPVPKLICVAWYSLDVLFTSSTICHLCMISIDRYMTLTYPLKYGHSKKKKHTMLKIAVVWMISFCIAGPLFIFSMKDTHNNIQYKGCGPETPIFVISASVTSFFLPLVIMTIMYALTVNALQQQLLEQRRMTVTNSSGSPPRRGSSAYGTTSKRPSTTLLQTEPFPPCLTLSGSGRAAVVRQMRGGLLHPQDYPRVDESSNLLIGGGHRMTRGGIGPSGPLSPKSPPCAEDTSGRFLVVTSDAGASFDHRRISIATTSSFVGSQMALHDLDSDAFSSRSNSLQATGSASIRQQMPSPSSSPSAAAVSTQRQQYIRSFTFRQSLSAASVVSSQRRGSATPDKGRRAVQVLGILFAVFVVCYLPFFAVYVLTSTCSPCQPYISAQTLVALEWLAYSGSMFNPIIYHVFNPDFRRAFHNLLHCNGRCSLSRPRTSAGHHGCCCCYYGNASSRRPQSSTCKTDCV